MTDIPTREPTIITAGDSVRWKRPASSFPASVYALSYALISNDRRILIAATGDGEDHLIDVAGSVTAEWPPGDYGWQLYAHRPYDRVTIDRGRLTVAPNFATMTGHDDRGHVRKVLDAIEATIEGRATADQQEYEILGRKMVKIPVTDLLVLRDRYKAELQRIEAAARIAKGLGGKNRILMRI